MMCRSVFRSAPTGSLAALLLCAAIPAWGQPTLNMEGESTGANVVVRAELEDPDEPRPLLQAIWRGVPGGDAVFQVLPTTEPRNDVRLMLDRLVEAGLGAYLDARIRFTRDGVHSDLPPEQLAHEMDAMVMAACEDFGVPDAFPGFSRPTIEQLGTLLRIDWSKARSAVDAGDGQDKYLAIYRFVRVQRDELERQMRVDLLPLASIVVIGPQEAAPGTTVRINSTCGTVFDEDNFLCALDLQLADTGNGGFDPELGLGIMRSMEERSKAAAVSEQAAPTKVRRRDQWLKAELDNINTRIDRMDQRKELWELRDRMDDIEDRITGLDMEVREMREARTERRDRSDNPLADLSDLTRRNLAVRFARNSVQLDAEYQVMLNEVFEQLARAPEDKVLITGYTDRSGDPAVNLRLSEQRAKAVRNYLLQRGIAPERLLVNYYGDSRSLGRNPDERRVEVEWLR
jgi:outer membrane protein OmpA-like peptidoglycan-associated protein